MPFVADMRIPERIVFALLVAWVIQILVYAPHLPTHVASNFNLAGEPNTFSTRAAFIVTLVVTMVILALSFLYLPRLVANTPQSTMSLPNKGYWLAPERRKRTAQFIRDQIAWIGATTVGFMIVLTQVVVDANLHYPPILSSSFVWLLALYLAGTLGWVLHLLTRFARVGTTHVERTR